MTRAAKDPGDLTERYRDVERAWTTQNWLAWQRTVAVGYRFEPGVGPDRDVQATLAWSKAIFTAFPDYTQTLERVVRSGQDVAGVAVAAGTFTGPLDLGLGPPLEPTGASFEIPYFKVLRFDNHALVLHDQQYLDADSWLAQLLR